MFEEQRRDRQLIERGVMDILGDTFSIYWRHFRKFVVLMAVIQIPVVVVELLLSLVAPDSDWVLVGVSVIDAMASLLVYGAVVFAVGQHLLANDISVERSYIRVTWRIVSVAIPALIVGTLFAALVWQAINIQGVVEPTTTETLETEVALSALLGAGVAIAVMVALLIFTIYLVAIMPAIIVEGYRSTSAFRRASELLQGSKLRVLGHLLIYGFVVLGLFFALSIPSFILGAAVAGETQSFAASAMGIVLNRIVSILIAPVTFIATTLLYYDLRIRKENYDIERLSTEMGYERA
ncbi:MAG: hypothetical protein F4Y49_10065 [Dehalococcoidia bacterium]|nr:hypothetical protein [Dehalococcoidia bacterium]